MAKIEGFDDLTKALVDTSFGFDEMDETTERAMDNAARRIAQTLWNSARRHVPKRSGNLHDSIAFRKIDDTEWIVEATADYAEIIEFGGTQTIESDAHRRPDGTLAGGMHFTKPDSTRSGEAGETTPIGEGVWTTEITHHIPTQPYMRPAIEETRRAVDDIVEEEISKAMQDAF